MVPKEPNKKQSIKIKLADKSIKKKYESNIYKSQYNLTETHEKNRNNTNSSNILGNDIKSPYTDTINKNFSTLIQQKKEVFSNSRTIYPKNNNEDKYLSLNTQANSNILMNTHQNLSYKNKIVNSNDSILKVPHVNIHKSLSVIDVSNSDLDFIKTTRGNKVSSDDRKYIEIPVNISSPSLSLKEDVKQKVFDKRKESDEYINSTDKYSNNNQAFKSSNTDNTHISYKSYVYDDYIDEHSSKHVPLDYIFSERNEDKKNSLHEKILSYSSINMKKLSSNISYEPNNMYNVEKNTKFTEDETFIYTKSQEIDNQIINSHSTQLSKSVLISVNTRSRSNNSKNNTNIKPPLSVPSHFQFNKFKQKIETLNEIFESELIYFNDIVKWSQVKAQTMQNYKFIGKKEVEFVDQMFSSLDAIIDLHSKIIETIVRINQSVWPRKLRDRYWGFDINMVSKMHFTESIHSLPSVTELNELSYTQAYLNVIDQFQPYINYIIKLPKSEYELDLEIKTNHTFKNLVESFFKDKKWGNLGYKHFLYRPLQKLSRYHMMFKTLRKYETNPVELKNISFFMYKIGLINMKVDNTYGEVRKYFDTFMLSKEIFYGKNVTRQYPLSLHYKGQKILKQGLYNVILNKHDIEDGKMVVDKRFVVVLSNLILICDFHENEKVKTKTIITTPYHILRTTCIDTHIEVDYFKDYYKKNQKSEYFLYLVEKQRTEIVIICFDDKISRDVLKSIINDAAKTLHSNINYKIAIKCVKTDKIVNGCENLYFSEKFVPINEYRNLNYDDNLIRYDFGYNETNDKYNDFSETEISSTRSTLTDKKCCLLNHGHKYILKDVLEEKTKILSLESNHVDLSKKSLPFAINNTLRHMYRHDIYKYQTNNYNSFDTIKLSGKSYISTQNIINKVNNQLVKKNPTKLCSTIFSEIKTTVTKRTNIVSIKNKILTMASTNNIKYLTLSMKQKPNFYFGLSKSVLQQKYFINEQQTGDLKLHNEHSRKKDSKTIEINRKNIYRTMNNQNFYQSNKLKEGKNKNIGGHMYYITDLSLLISSNITLNYIFSTKKHYLEVFVPQLKGNMRKKPILGLYSENYTIFNKQVEKFSYDNIRNIVFILSQGIIYSGFFTTDKPIEYTTITTGCKNFFYNKKGRTIAVIKETIDKTSIIVIYKLFLYDGDDEISDKQHEYTNKIDKKRTYKVEINGTVKNLQKIRICSYRDFKIKVITENKLYIGPPVDQVYFIGDLVVVLCHDFVIVNKNTLETIDVIDSLDFIIPYYTKHLKKPSAIKILPINEKKFLLVYEICGFFIDNYGRNISDHRIFSWLSPVNDAKLIYKKEIKKLFNIDSVSDWICLLSSNTVEIWDAETGNIIFIHSIKNCKFVSNSSIPIFLADNMLLSFCAQE